MNPNFEWPEAYGFWIYGEGPSYVIHVENGSIAEKSGINPADRIVELDNQDVTEYNDKYLKLIAKNSMNNPPYISVQSALREIDLEFLSGSFGFTFSGDLPVIIDKVIYNHPTYFFGIKKGDIIIQVNNQPITNSNNLKIILKNYRNKFISLKYISASEDRLNYFLRSTSQFGAKNERFQIFYDNICQLFSNDLNKRNFILNEIVHYNHKGDIDELFLSIYKILDSYEKKYFFNYLKPLIPPSHKKRFESLITSKKIDSNKRCSLDKKFDHILSSRDKKNLKKLICYYMETKNFEIFYKNVNVILDTRIKKLLWEDIGLILDSDHRKCLNANMKNKCLKKSNSIRIHCEKPKKQIYLVEKCEPVYLCKSKIYSSAPSVYCFEEEKDYCSDLLNQYNETYHFKNSPRKKTCKCVRFNDREENQLPNLTKSCVDLSQMENKRVKSMFGWEPDSSDEEIFRSVKKQNELKKELTESSNESESELYESEEQNLEFHYDEQITNEFNKKMFLEDSNDYLSRPVYAKSSSSFNNFLI
ncbi:unnamed protein product [Brachionus calyciflorus]|uniref:PDZ domain-containing protein n=1 Tax=Brachionus calyciflorus TaxID=104777 RepID=A0A814GKQ2_9BILA|nr:unnamed protein product [Brachionus calyciflorus]